jgi:type IV pilus assembly protein PilA
MRSEKLDVRGGKGFTLIELLIVVVVIGLLAAIAMPNLVGIRQRGSDGQRKSHIRQIQAALELYRSDNGAYPVVNGVPYRLNATACTTSSALTSGTTTYIQSVFCDPSGTSTYNDGNYYYYTNASGTTYALEACLQNAGDTGENVVSTTPSPVPTNVTSTTCTSGKFYKVQNP